MDPLKSRELIILSNESSTTIQLNVRISSRSIKFYSNIFIYLTID